MRLRTAQMSLWRQAKASGIFFLDTTVKTGDSVFAPTWELVRAIKSGMIDEREYTDQYLALMRGSYTEHKNRWIGICNMSEVILACYCSAGSFCHRHILARCLEGVCRSNHISFELAGEYQPVRRT